MTNIIIDVLQNMYDTSEQGLIKITKDTFEIQSTDVLLVFINIYVVKANEFISYNVKGNHIININFRTLISFLKRNNGCWQIYKNVDGLYESTTNGTSKLLLSERSLFRKAIHFNIVPKLVDEWYSFSMSYTSFNQIALELSLLGGYTTISMFTDRIEIDSKGDTGSINITCKNGINSEFYIRVPPKNYFKNKYLTKFLLHFNLIGLKKEMTQTHLTFFVKENSPLIVRSDYEKNLYKFIGISPVSCKKRKKQE